MRQPLQFLVIGAAAVSLITVPLWRSDRLHAASAQPSAGVDPADLCPRLQSPARQALRESAYWIAQARQSASDEADAWCQTLQAWDPAAPCDRAEARRQRLASDPGGCLRRARQALERAEALARTPEEHRRVAVTRAILSAAADPGEQSARPVSGE